MNELYKEAHKDAKMIHKTVRLKMSFLYWMNNVDKKSKIAERTKEDLLSVPEVGIRHVLPQAYNKEECNFYWKTFYAEYDRLNSLEPVIP